MGSLHVNQVRSELSNYRLLEKLGAAAMGVVYRANDQRTRPRAPVCRPRRGDGSVNQHLATMASHTSMIRMWSIMAACAAVLSIAACDRSPTRPIYDGFTLHGVVLDAGSGDPLGDVQVLVGSEGSEEWTPYATTGANGRFEFQPAPNTAPSSEVFRFEKPGYISQDALARSALRLRQFEYQLEVRLERSGP